MAIATLKFEVVRYNNNLTEVLKTYSDFIKRLAWAESYPGYIVLRTDYYWDVMLYEGDWLVLSWDFDSDGVEIYSDTDFKSKYDTHSN